MTKRHRFPSKRCLLLSNEIEVSRSLLKLVKFSATLNFTKRIGTTKTLTINVGGVISGMARPRKNGLDDFPHNTKAIEDDRIDALRSFYGNDGYAFYFIMSEHIHRNEFGELDISNPLTAATLARAVMVTVERFHAMLTCAIKLGLFSAEEFEVRGVLTTSKIKKLSGSKAAERNKWRRCKSSIITDSTSTVSTNREFSTVKTPVFHGENEFSTVKTPVFHGDNPKTTPEFSTVKTPPDAVSSNNVLLKDLSSSSRSLPPTNAHMREAPPPFEYEGKLDVLQAMNHYGLSFHGFLHYETIRTFQGILDDELILAAIKESGGRSDSYCVRVVASWHGKGWRKITDHPNYRPLPEGGEVIEIVRGRVERQRTTARNPTQIAFEEAGRRSRPGRQVYAPRE